MPDPYLLPNGTIRNKLGEKDADVLALREGQIVAARTIQLRGRSGHGIRGIADLCAIHRHLFGDVYEWAGEFRSVDLSKQVEVGNPELSSFTARRNLDRQAREIDAALQASDHLAGLDRETFAKTAADLLVMINRLHPFREGNGRTQRFFMEELAQAAGHALDFSVVTRERMVSVSVQGHRGDLEAMRRLFLEISDPNRIAVLDKAIRFLQGTQIPWNDLYIATTVEGQVYAGRLVGRAGRDFMMRVDEPDARLLVGDVIDLNDAACTNDDVDFTASRFGPP